MVLFNKAELCSNHHFRNDIPESDYRYAGNSLCYISMCDHMYSMGYVRNVPGAPLCGVSERSPLSQDLIAQKSQLEIWKFHWDAGAGAIKEGEFQASLDRTEIEFKACTGRGPNNDLEAFYDRLYIEGRASL